MCKIQKKSSKITKVDMNLAYKSSDRQLIILLYFSIHPSHAVERLYYTERFNFFLVVHHFVIHCSVCQDIIEIEWISRNYLFYLNLNCHSSLSFTCEFDVKKNCVNWKLDFTVPLFYFFVFIFYYKTTFKT